MIATTEQLAQRVGLTTACEVLGVPRSSVYRARHPLAKDANDLAIQANIVVSQTNQIAIDANSLGIQANDLGLLANDLAAQALDIAHQSNDIALGLSRIFPEVRISFEDAQDTLYLDPLLESNTNSYEWPGYRMRIFNIGKLPIDQILVRITNIDARVLDPQNLQLYGDWILPIEWQRKPQGCTLGQAGCELVRVSTYERSLDLSEQLLPGGEAIIDMTVPILEYFRVSDQDYDDPDTLYTTDLSLVISVRSSGEPRPVRTENSIVAVTVEFTPALMSPNGLNSFIETHQVPVQVFPPLNESEP